MKAVITGASGLLGRAVTETFENSSWEVVGTAFSRANNKLVKLDLTNYEAANEFLDQHKPDVLVHCAAERRPDVAENDRDGVLRLNVETPKNLALLCKSKGIMLIYISTDYVFDGTKPPYEVDDKPNPLQFYGESKLGGENAIREVFPEAVILRVPILYGSTEFNGESAVNLLLDVVMNGGKPATMDAIGIRYPTNVLDVAQVLRDLADTQAGTKKTAEGIYHFSGQQGLTKYQMCEIFAKILNVSIDHIKPQTTVDKSGAASRPENAHLSIKRLQDEDYEASNVSFTGWFTEHLNNKTN